MDLPKVKCLEDIFNDDNYQKSSNYSDINICHAASPDSNASPGFSYDFSPRQPEPEPPLAPPPIWVTEVLEHRCSCDKSIPKGTLYLSYNSTPPHIPLDKSHLLWISHIFPTSELEDNSISPATILKLLDLGDATRFTSPITANFLYLRHFQL